MLISIPIETNKRRDFPQIPNFGPFCSVRLRQQCSFELFPLSSQIFFFSYNLRFSISKRVSSSLRKGYVEDVTDIRIGFLKLISNALSLSRLASEMAKVRRYRCDVHLFRLETARQIVMLS